MSKTSFCSVPTSGIFPKPGSAPVQQGGHLVDEGPGTSGTGAVHPLLQSPTEEDDLGVLAAQLDDGVARMYFTFLRMANEI